jgi:uncharacterized protein (DUF3820 family)
VKTSRYAAVKPTQTDPAEERPETCNHCGSSDLFTVECEPGGPHHARQGCSGCGRFLQWVGRPIDPTSAANFVMPFGKHKGRQLGAIDSGYLEWLRDNCDSRSITRRTRLVLAARAKGGAR